MANAFKSYFIAILKIIETENLIFFFFRPKFISLMNAKIVFSLVITLFIPHHKKSGGVLCYTLRTVLSVRPSEHTNEYKGG